MKEISIKLNDIPKISITTLSDKTRYVFYLENYRKEMVVFHEYHNDEHISDFMNDCIKELYFMRAKDILKK